VFTPGAVILAIIFSVAGTAFYLLGFSGRWWNGFFMIMLGMMLGQAAGLSLMAWIPRWQDSDGPFILGGAAGVLVMVAFWLCLPEKVVIIFGHIARALLGGALGLTLGLATMSSKPYTPQDGKDRMEKPGAAADRPPE